MSCGHVINFEVSTPPTCYKILLQFQHHGDLDQKLGIECSAMCLNKDIYEPASQYPIDYKNSLSKITMLAVGSGG